MNDCMHEQWEDDTQSYEEVITLKCSNCGLFEFTEQPNPNFNAETRREQDRDDAKSWTENMSRRAVK